MRSRRPRNHNARDDAFFRHNRQIRISPIRLIDAEGEMVGVVPTEQALRMAQDAGLDLVEIAPNIRPPVCRILDYGKWKYEQQKKNDKQRATQRHTTLKEVKIRTTKIDPHDLSIKINSARRFLESGHKVQIALQYRGREMAHQDIGRDLMDRVKRDLFMISKVEQDFRMQGRRGNMVLAPDTKDAKKFKAPADHERITVGTKAVPINSDPPQSHAAAMAGENRMGGKGGVAAGPGRPTLGSRPVASLGIPARNADDAVIPGQRHIENGDHTAADHAAEDAVEQSANEQETATTS